MLNRTSTHVAKAVQSGGMAFCVKRRPTPMGLKHLASASLAAEHMVRHKSTAVHTLVDAAAVVTAGEATQFLKEQSTSLAAGGKALVGNSQWQARPDLVMLSTVVAGVVGLGMYNDSMAGKSEARLQANQDKSDARMQATLKETVASMQATLKESEARMQKSQDKSETRMQATLKETVASMQAHLDQRLDEQNKAIKAQGKSTTKALDRVAKAITRLETEQKVAAQVQRDRDNERNGSADR